LVGGNRQVRTGPTGIPKASVTAARVDELRRSLASNYTNALPACGGEDSVGWKILSHTEDRSGQENNNLPYWGSTSLDWGPGEGGPKRNPA